MYVCVYVCVSNNSKSTGPNLMKFGGMIGHDLRINRLDFGSDRVKGQGQGHKKVKKKDFRPYLRQYLADRNETNAQSIIFWE